MQRSIANQLRLVHQTLSIQSLLLSTLSDVNKENFIHSFHDSFIRRFVYALTHCLYSQLSFNLFHLFQRLLYGFIHTPNALEQRTRLFNMQLPSSNSTSSRLISYSLHVCAGNQHLWEVDIQCITVLLGNTVANLNKNRTARLKFTNSS